MSRTSSAQKAEDFSDYTKGISERFKMIETEHDEIESKLNRGQSAGAELLNKTFDHAFGLEEKNRK